MNAPRDTDRRSSNVASAFHQADRRGNAATPARLTHRARDFGIGYGSSSGYGCTRRYATLSSQRLFRCA